MEERGMSSWRHLLDLSGLLFDADQTCRASFSSLIGVKEHRQEQGYSTAEPSA
jgi:hypothetical protein